VSEGAVEFLLQLPDTDQVIEFLNVCGDFAWLQPLMGKRRRRYAYSESSTQYKAPIKTTPLAINVVSTASVQSSVPQNPTSRTRTR